MNSNQDFKIPDNLQQEEFNLKELIVKILRHWKWIVLSLLICTIGSYYYLKSQINYYKSNARVMVKDIYLGGPTMELEIFNDLGFGGAYTTVYNEIEVFKTRTLLREVVKALGLQAFWVKESSFPNKDQLFYKDEPVKVDLSKIDLNNLEHSITLIVFINNNDAIEIEQIYSKNFQNYRDKIGFSRIWRSS
jgi:tyrosine-protein kinase Etk/Wzc